MAINPQYVNISPIYAGSLLVVAMVLATVLAIEAGESFSGVRPLWAGLPVGIIAAALAGLKLTLAFYASTYMAFIFAFLAVNKSCRCQNLKLAGTMISTALLGVLPWVFLSAPTYLRARQLGASHASMATLVSKHASVSAHDIGRVFSFGNLFYGGNQFHYAIILLFLGAVGLAVIIPWRKAFEGSANINIVVASASLSGAAVYLLNAHLFPIHMAVRYTCPVLIGAVPLSALMCSRILRLPGNGPIGQDTCSLLKRYSLWSVALLQTVILLVFLPVSALRVNRACRTATLLSYPFDQGFLAYNQIALGQEHARKVREFQNNIAAEQTLLVWTAEPFLFDFRRNHILTVSESGLLNPLLHFPAGVSSTILAEYLRNWGVRYVALETEGYAVKSLSFLERLLQSPYAVFRKFGDYGLSARRTLAEIAETRKIVARSEHLLLIDLESEASPRRQTTERTSGYE